jgi:hypothetical protein
MRRSHDEGQKLIHTLVERGRHEGQFRTDVPTQWLVSAFFALMHTAYDDVAAGRLEASDALEALLATVPDLFRGG